MSFQKNWCEITVPELFSKSHLICEEVKQLISKKKICSYAKKTAKFKITSSRTEILYQSLKIYQQLDKHHKSPPWWPKDKDLHSQIVTHFNITKLFLQKRKPDKKRGKNATVQCSRTQLVACSLCQKSCRVEEKSFSCDLEVLKSNKCIRCRAHTRALTYRHIVYSGEFYPFFRPVDTL